MKSLLVAVNAKYIHSNLAVYSLKAFAGKYAEQVELAEYTINHQTDDIFRSIYSKKPQLLFFSCYIWNRRVIVELAENLRKVLPNLVIWAGGPEVSYDARSFLEAYPQFDGVMCGEGERTFAQVLRYYEEAESSQTTQRAQRAETAKKTEKAEQEETAKRAEKAEEAEREAITGKAEKVQKKGLNLHEIQGIAYRCAGEIIETQAAVPMTSLDEIPFVYDSPFLKGCEAVFENRIIYYESSRGCPFSCSYCLSSLDKRVRFRSLSLVKKELSYFLERKVSQVKFVDRTFNARESHALEIWRYIQAHDNGVTNFHFEIAADILTQEELTVLGAMRPGLVQLEIGVQTTNGAAIDAICRKTDFDAIARCSKRIAEGKNIHQHLDLIAGLPYEDFDSFQKSFDDVYRLKPQELQLGFLKVLRGSRMHQCAKEYGIIYRSTAPYEVLATRWITCEELLRLKEVEEMLEMYYNSQQFRYTMEALEQMFDRPFEMYAALADYHKECAGQERSYSRMQRFELLRGFIQKMIQASAEKLLEKTNMQAKEIKTAFDELLTFDFYLRENAKSRPAWARDQKEDQKDVIAFYQREEQERRFLSGYKDRSWKQMMRMTHLEWFTKKPEEYVQILRGDKITEKESRTDGQIQPEDGKGVWALFDYAKRDPLTNDAFVQYTGNMADVYRRGRMQW